jgi:hypothetical protein
MPDLVKLNLLNLLNMAVASGIVIWYYNGIYSQTGCICRTIEECLHYISCENRHVSREIREKLERGGDFINYETWDEVKRVEFYGDIDKLNEYDYLYVLRFPKRIYANKEEACRFIMEEVVKQNKTYNWNRKQDVRNRTYTTCNEDWVKEVCGDDFSNKWQKLWEAYIEEDEFSRKNHIERVDCEWYRNRFN